MKSRVAAAYCAAKIQGTRDIKKSSKGIKPTRLGRHKPKPMASMPSPRATTPIKTGKMGHRTQTPTCSTPDGAQTWSISSILWVTLSLIIICLFYHSITYSIIPSLLASGTVGMPIDRQCVSPKSPSSGLYVYYIRPSNPGGITGPEGGWAVGVWRLVCSSFAAS